MQNQSMLFNMNGDNILLITNIDLKDVTIMYILPLKSNIYNSLASLLRENMS